MTKRILSIALCLLLLCTTAAFSWAEEETIEVNPEEFVGKIFDNAIVDTLVSGRKLNYNAVYQIEGGEELDDDFGYVATLLNSILYAFTVQGTDNAFAESFTISAKDQPWLTGEITCVDKVISVSLPELLGDKAYTISLPELLMSSQILTSNGGEQIIDVESIDIETVTALSDPAAYAKYGEIVSAWVAQNTVITVEDVSDKNTDEYLREAHPEAAYVEYCIITGEKVQELVAALFDTLMTDATLNDAIAALLSSQGIVITGEDLAQLYTVYAPSIKSLVTTFLHDVSYYALSDSEFNNVYSELKVTMYDPTATGAVPQILTVQVVSEVAQGTDGSTTKTAEFSVKSQPSDGSGEEVTYISLGGSKVVNPIVSAEGVYTQQKTAVVEFAAMDTLVTAQYEENVRHEDATENTTTFITVQIGGDGADILDVSGFEVTIDQSIETGDNGDFVATIDETFKYIGLDDLPIIKMLTNVTPGEAISEIKTPDGAINILALTEEEIAELILTIEKNSEDISLKIRELFPELPDEIFEVEVVTEEVEVVELEEAPEEVPVG